MMGRRTGDQARLFYEFDLDERVPADHLLRRIDVFAAAALAELHHELANHYSHTGRPSIARSTESAQTSASFFSRKTREA